MKYTLTEVDEIPQDGRASRVPVGFYEDILKVFRENQYRMAKVEVTGKNPDTIARRLLIHAPDEISVISRGDEVYLRNNYLVIRDESDN
jgi:hypothetical protein